MDLIKISIKQSLTSCPFFQFVTDSVVQTRQDILQNFGEMIIVAVSIEAESVRKSFFQLILSDSFASSIFSLFNIL